MISLVIAFVVYSLLRVQYQHRQSLSNADRLETLLKNLPGMAYRCFNRRNWPMEFVSEGCFQLCGYERRDLEEQRVLWGEFTHPDEIERVERIIKGAVQKGEPFEVEYRIVTRSNEEKWVWERGRVVDSRDGEFILEGFITDITDRKLTETALMHAEAYSKAVVETAVEAVITINESGTIETFNRAAQAMFGYTFEEVEGKNIRLLMSDPDHAEFESYIAHHMQGATLRIADAGREDICRCKDGSVFPVHLSVSEVLSQTNGDKKNERKFVGLFRDLTAQRAAEQEAREQREQLAHVDRLNTLGEMATGIAHEINQPLTAISMYAQSGLRFLDSESPKIDRLYDVLEKLSTQAHRAGAVMERMQQLTKQHDSLYEDVECNTLICDVHKLAEVEAHLRNMVIYLELSAGLKQVLCDPVQIQQVILNLLRNGMEAMKSADCQNGSRIILRTEPSGTGVKISIIDSGTGISEEFSERLYMSFSSTKDSGMGMGLSISRSIINAHGGQLEYVNNESCGVTFFFTLAYA